jgi:hypothetical protein
MEQDLDGKLPHAELIVRCSDGELSEFLQAPVPPDECFGFGSLFNAEVTLRQFPSYLEKQRYVKKNAKSGIWRFFEIYTEKQLKHLAYCKICKEDINYTLTISSTSMLTRHSRKYQAENEEMLEPDALSKVQASSMCSAISSSLDGSKKMQSSIESYVKFGLVFEKSLIGLFKLTNLYLCMCVSIPLSEKCAIL